MLRLPGAGGVTPAATREGREGLSVPSTCTRAYPSMLPAGVLLTHLYMVPSYTSTLLMRSVPFSEISNRESCPKRGKERGTSDAVTSPRVSPRLWHC